MTLGARIREERKRLGLNQTEFAAIAGASKRAMVNWESDGAAPLITAAIAWAEAGADALYILTGRRTAADRPNNALTQIEDQLSEIRRTMIEPTSHKLPEETDDVAEERAISSVQGQLKAMMNFDLAFVTPEIQQEIEHLLDIAENPASLALYRAADSAQLRSRRREMRKRIAEWFNPERYSPNDTVLNAMVALVLEYGTPHKQVVELVEDVFDDVSERNKPSEKAPA